MKPSPAAVIHLLERMKFFEAAQTVKLQNDVLEDIATDGCACEDYNGPCSTCKARSVLGKPDR